jgi:hypothetical protein
MDESFLEPGHEPPLGAHLITQRRFYTHHGIYVGEGRVIHYAGLVDGSWRGRVEDVSLVRFGKGRSIGILRDARVFDRKEVVTRARSRLGERRYRILTNNCEHFCAWSLGHEVRSPQVDRVLGALQRLADIPRGLFSALGLPWTSTSTEWCRRAR